MFCIFPNEAQRSEPLRRHLESAHHSHPPGANTVQNVKDKAYEVLRQRLIGGHYRPGEQLKEEPIARDLGLSRTPVRNALHLSLIHI